MRQFNSLITRIVQSKIRSPKYRRGALFTAYGLLFAGGIYSIIRGFHMPIDYPICQWFTTYEFGFIKRGLVGTLIHPYMFFKTGDEIREMIRVWALLLLLFKLICASFICMQLLHYANRHLKGGRGLIWTLVGVFALSPHLVYTAHVAGYFDHILELCTVAAVVAIYREKYVLVPFITVAALFVHEMFAVYGLPIIGLTLVLKLFGPKSAPIKFPVAATTLMVSPVILAGMFLCCAQQVYSARALAHMERSATRYNAASSQCIANMVDHLGEDVTDSWQMQKKEHVVERLTQPEVMKSMYPPIGLFWFVGIVLLVKARHWTAIPIFTLASLSPLTTNLIAWDGSRFAANAMFQTFLGVFAIVLLLRPVFSPGKLFHFFAVLLTLAVGVNCIVHPVPLMAGREDGAGLFALRRRPQEQTFAQCTPLFPNATFDRGTLQNWRGTGEVFTPDHEILRDAKHSKTALGKYWLLTYSRKIDAFGHFLGDLPTGELTSTPFIIQHNRIIFRMAGGNNIHQTYAALFVEGKEVRRATGLNDNALTTRTWSVHEYLGKEAVIKVVDDSSDDWGHIDVDQFCWSN